MTDIQIDIVDVPEPEDTVPELVPLVEQVDESGKAGQFTVPRELFPSTVRKLHAAAKYLDRSTRKKAQHDDGENVTYVFVVGPRVYRPRKPKDNAQEPATAKADA